MYSLISDLGKSVDYRSEQANPLSYCLYPNYNSQWLHGSTSVNLLNTPYCDPCQNIMADRCSKTWDEACDIYVNHNCDTSWPNSGSIDVMSQRRSNEFLKFTPTVGDNLLRNSVERSLFIYPTANSRVVQFDPNVADSPMYKTYSVNSLSPAWQLHPNVLQNSLLHDDNKHVQLMLENPYACFDLLARLHYLGTTKSPHFKLALNQKKGCSQLLNFLNANSSVLSEYNKKVRLG